MTLFNRIGNIVRSNLNNTVSQPESPETVINLKIREMEEYSVQLRQNIANAIANQKCYQQQHNQNQLQAEKCDSRAQLAREKGDENLAKDSNTPKSEVDDELTAMKDQLVLIEKVIKQQTSKANTLKKILISLESKVSESKTQKNMLKVRILRG